MYSHVGNAESSLESSVTTTNTNHNNDSMSMASNNKRRFGRKRINSELSEPLTAGGSVMDESLGSNAYDTSDPYFVFRSELQTKLNVVDDSLADYIRVVHETDTAVNRHEYKETKKRLKRDLKRAEATLRDVLVTVSAVEQNRAQFAHIDDGQLYERKTMVSTSKERLVKAKEELTSEAVQLKLLEDERNNNMQRGGDALLGATNDVERHNTKFIQDNQAQTSLLLSEQDDTLDELGEAVTRVGEMAGNIHEEIGQQNKMLDDLDEDLTNVEEELGMVMGNLARFLKTKNQWHLKSILILSLVALILLFLVIYA